MEHVNYLTALLPKGVNVRCEMRKRLNEKGLRSVRGKEYTDHIVANALDGKTKDATVNKELIDWVVEANPPKAINRFLNDQRRILNDVENSLIENLAQITE